jgi:hypothetical protein
VSPAVNSPRSKQGSPKFLGNHDCPFAHVLIRRRRDCVHQTMAVQQRGPSRALLRRLPQFCLSALNSMAFGLAVYASRCGLLLRHARLASSCWSGSTGRAFHPHDSTERFQSCELHHILLSQACLAQRAWHWSNRLARLRCRLSRGPLLMSYILAGVFLLPRVPAATVDLTPIPCVPRHDSK